MSLAFPNVPQLLGVPQVVRALGGTVTQVVIGTPIGNILSQASQSSNIWGVFDGSNNQVLNPDSIREFDTRAEWHISNYPVQQGSFTSYNKVTLAAEYSVQMVKGGTVSARQAFESQLDAIAQSLTLYTIVTPEKSYKNCNVSRYEKTRKGAGGAFFTSVDLFFIQIIQVDAQYSTTANATAPSAIPNAAQGTVSPQPVPQSTANAMGAVGIP